MIKNAHILNAASNLLGIALVIIAGINIANRAEKTFADEIAWAAAVLLGLSCLLSYMAIRAAPEASRFEAWADRIFLCGLIALFVAVLVLASPFR